MLIGLIPTSANLSSIYLISISSVAADGIKSLLEPITTTSNFLTRLTTSGFNVPLKVNKSTIQTIKESVATASLRIFKISLSVS